MRGGIRLFDTADCYGAGHSEKLIGEALSSHRDEIVIVTKFANIFNESTRDISGDSLDPGYIRRAVEASLKRLKTDYIDSYVCHAWSMQVAEVNPVFDTLDSLVKEGKIRSFGWSTDLVTGAKMIAGKKHCAVIEHGANVFESSEEMMNLCQTHSLTGLIRGPLAMGLLSGKYNAGYKFDDNDLRSGTFEWLTYFEKGEPKESFLKKLDSIREILTSESRSLVQGALAWLWAKNPSNVPIPGFRTEKQVKENLGAIQKGPLTPQQMKEIDNILGRAEQQR